MYVSAEDYKNICPDGDIPEDRLIPALDQAEKDIDSLTFNRITTKGFDALTEFQQDLVKRAVCYQANFRCDCAEMLDSPLSSYGINGVTMVFDSHKVQIIGGVSTLPHIYALLNQTGLTYRELKI